MCLRAAPWFCWCSRLASLAQSSLGPAQYRRWAFIQHCISELIIANLLLPYIANPAPHISTPCIRTFPWQSFYTIFGVIWHCWLPVTTCRMVRTCKILIFALLWALYNHILVVHRNIILKFCFLFLLIMIGSRDRSSWTMDTSSPSRELGQHTQAYG